MKLEGLHCCYCAQPLKESDLILEKFLARCSSCKAVFKLEGGKGDTAEERAPMSAPKGVSIRIRNGNLQIDRRWFSLSHVIIFLFSIPWNAFLILWHGNALSSGLWFMSVFGLLHTAVGVGLVYYAFAGFLNTTSILVNSKKLHVRHHPLPWFGQRVFPAGEIGQLYTIEKIRSSNKGTYYRYRVMARNGRGKSMKVISGLEDVDHALYIEQQIEKFLRLKDRPVRGEVPR